MKKTYISPAIEIVVKAIHEHLLDISPGGIPNSNMGDDGGPGSNEGMFDEDDNGFTPVATSLWD